MSVSVSNSNNSSTTVQYRPIKRDEVEVKDKATLKESTIGNKLRASYQKTTSAFTEYPAKGLKGSKKSNFYEFLSMGVVPYILGSVTFMALFGGVNKKFDLFAAKANGPKKLAMGVLFFAAAKNLSKYLISTPVKMATGIDTEMGYERHVYTPNPNTPPEFKIDEYEQHKAMESHDFPRYDIMYGDDKEHPRNFRFDKIAKKNGLGENLTASDTEVKPIIKDVISRSSTAKSISTYLWAAAGVALAAQNSWNNFFRAASSSKWVSYKPSTPDASMIEKGVGKVINTSKNLGRIAASFGRNFVKASKELYHGPEGTSGFQKHAGKFLLGAAAISSIIGVANTIYGARTAVGQNKNVFDRKEKVTVQ